MPDANDMDLVREYASRNSEPAFETLVRRHLSLVYSVALRQAGNPAQAEEITQAVFLILARKAARLRPDTVLAGWLHETARFASASFLRGEQRRRRREQEAYMQSKLQESAADPAWEQLAPLLDEAIGQLGKADRDAVVLRFFQNKSAREIAAALNVHESAAQKRLNRAVEKLRAYFLKRGVAVSAGALLGALSVNSVQGAPAHLAASVMAVSAKGTVVRASTLTLIKGALKIMAWTKAKTAIVAGVAIFLTAGTATVVMVKTVNAIRRAAVPDLQGAWEGVEEIGGTPGVLQGEKASSRIVFKFFKTNGAYSATGEFIDTASEPFRVTKFTLDYPSVRLEVGQNVSYQGTLKADATEISGTYRTRNFAVPMLLKRTNAPDSAPEPLAENDYMPRTGSDLQGCWKATLGTIHITVKIAEPSSGTFRAELDNLTTSWVGQPLSVTYNQPEVKLRVVSGAGLFQGEVRNGNTEMAGNWIQGGRQTPVVFQRASR
jgi:RNA polymerase sigma factor (sigma-70 family)